MPRSIVLAIGVLAAALFLLPLVRPVPLLDPDEGLHAAITQEMIARADAIVPRFLGEPFLDKPILFFWAQLAAMRVLGENEAAARLPGLAFGLFGALATGWLASTVLRARAGWIAAPLYATMLVPMALAEVPVHDIAVVPFTTVALLAFWRAARAPSSRTVVSWSALAGVALGGAILAKGLTGVALVGIAHGVVLLLERRLTPAIVIGGVLALAIGVAIAAPWYLAMERFNPGYLHYYFVERHLSGFATETQRHGQRSWAYYVPVILGGGLPAGVYAVLAIGRGTTAEPSSADARRLGWAWLLGGWIFLSVAGSKLFTYALPLFPSLALLATLPWVAWLSGRPWPRPAVLDRAVLAHALVAALLLPAVVVAGQVSGIARVTPGSLVALVAVSVAWGAAATLWRRRRAVPAAVLATMATAVTVGTVLASVLPQAATAYTARDLALALNARATLPPQVLVVRDRIGSVVFYLDDVHRRGLTPERITSVQPRELVATVVRTGAVVAIRARDVERVERFLDLSRARFDTAGPYRLYDAHDLGLHATAP